MKTIIIIIILLAVMDYCIIAAGAKANKRYDEAWGKRNATNTPTTIGGGYDHERRAEKHT